MIEAMRGRHYRMQGRPIPLTPHKFVQYGHVGIPDEQFLLRPAVTLGEIVQQRQQASRAIAAARAPDDIDRIVSGEFPQRRGPLLVCSREREGLFGALLMHDRFKSRLVQPGNTQMKFYLRNTRRCGQNSDAHVAHGFIRSASSIASRGQPMSTTVTNPVNSSAPTKPALWPTKV